MKYEKKFRSSEQQEQLSEAQLQSSQTVHEFATPDEVLQFDAKNTVVPEGIAQRLGRSSHRVPASSRSWWKRLFQ